MGLFDSSNDRPDSVYSSTYGKDLHIERSGSSFFIADSSGRAVGSNNGQMSSDRAFVEKKLREYTGR